VPFYKSIISNVQVYYQNQIETNLLQLFAHPETAEWFSIIFSIISEVNIVAEQKQAQLGFVLYKFALPLTLSLHPHCICSGVPATKSHTI